MSWGTGNWELGTGGRDFENLEAWQKAIDLAVLTYTVTRNFPKEEMYALTSQMRRAASSVSANIAEGHGRYNIKEKIQFYTIANGSLAEIKSFCYLAERLEYLNSEQIEQLTPLIITNQKLLNGLIRSLKAKL